MSHDAEIKRLRWLASAAHIDPELRDALYHAAETIEALQPKEFLTHDIITRDVAVKLGLLDGSIDE